MKFLEGLSADLKKNLLEQLRVLWTHTSTALEGNTLSLGETAFILREGLTISGKPLKDHRDIEGHARAVDLVFDLLDKPEITEANLFDLHRLIIDEQILDVYKPVGGWKRENNSTNLAIDGGQRLIEYSNHWDVPRLMERWLKLLNQEMQPPKGEQDLLTSYARLHLSLASIHPFWDGNGRIARIVSNLPILKGGYPPLIIGKDRRYDYILAIAGYQLAHGVPAPDTDLYHTGEHLDRFRDFCQENWTASVELVDQAHALQRNRDRGQA